MFASFPVLFFALTTLAVAQSPDLLVTAIDRGGLAVDAQTLSVSGDLRITVRNRGDAPAPVCQLTVFFDANGNGALDPPPDRVLANAAVPIVPAGKQVGLVAPLTMRQAFRDDLIHVFVDSGRTVGESNEANNVSDTRSICLQIPRLEWSWTGVGGSAPASTNTVCTPLVCDLDGDGFPEIVFQTSSSTGGSNQINGELRAVDGRTGAEVFTVSSPMVTASFTPAIGDIDGDGRPEIVTLDATTGSTVRHLLCFEHDGTPKWTSDGIENPGFGAVAIADLDQDGTPEIVVGRQALDNQGLLLWTGTGATTNPLALTSLVADIDLDGSPEIVAGSTIYSATGLIEVSFGVAGDGFDAVANFDSDPQGEWLHMGVGARPTVLRNHDGSVVWTVPSSTPFSGRGGPPTIADYDGDGEPEIGIAGTSLFRVFDTDGTTLWQRTIRDVSSGMTASAAFDFDNDGAFDVIYRDETTLWIFRGIDGAILWSLPMSSCTWIENVVVADVDADGQAELIVGANVNCGVGPQRGLHVFGDARNAWPATRRVWNQFNYSITNVNEDGTIPAVPAENWATPSGSPYNNFRVNPALSTPQRSFPDLAVGALVLPCQGPRNVIARVGNGGALTAPAGVRVDFFHGDPSAGGSLIGSTTTGVPLAPGDWVDVGIAYAGALNQDVHVMVDPLDVIAECSEDNNRHSAATCAPASMSNYGVGWPGTNGIPSLALDAVPQLGTTRQIRIGNSFGQPTSAVLAIGVAPATLNFGFGGTLLVDAFMLPLVPLGTGITVVTFAVPCTAESCGASLFLQAIEIDPGASQLLSFSRGLQITFGG